MPAELYHDRWISCTERGLVIRWYYFPFGTKRIPYRAIRNVESVPLTLWSGRGRIWGTSNPRYWLGLDPGRLHKQTALILDTGHWVRPVITPDDPDAVLAIINAHRGG